MPRFVVVAGYGQHGAPTSAHNKVERAIRAMRAAGPTASLFWDGWLLAEACPTKWAPGTYARCVASGRKRLPTYARTMVDTAYPA
jgi:hypothetical protein